MYALKFQAMLVVCTCAILSQPATAQFRSDNSEAIIQFLLAKTQERLLPIHNYSCTQIIAEPESSSLMPERRLLNIDRQGRGRIRIIKNQNALTCICDGTQTIELRQNSEPNAPFTYSASIAPGMQGLIQKYNEPWRYLGGTLADELNQVRDQGGRLYAIELDSGQYRIDAREKEGRTHTYILDPSQGYVPIERKTIVDGTIETDEIITFEEIDPNVWFPTIVHSKTDPSIDTRDTRNLEIKYRFINAAVNGADFEQALVTRFTKGTEVFDAIRGEYYIVGTETLKPLEEVIPNSVQEKKWNSLSGDGNEPWRKRFDATYHLLDNETLKYVAAPFIPERINYLTSVLPDLNRQNDREIQSWVYLFEWDKDSIEVKRISEYRFATLSTILETVVHLSSYEYEGPTYLLNRRLTGDWIVRKKATTEQRLETLELILQNELRRTVSFTKSSTQDIVIRATGTSRFTPLQDSPDPRGVLVQAGNWDTRQGNTILSTGNGTTTAMLDQVGNAIGMLIINQTTPSDQPWYWMMHESSNLREIKNIRGLYNPQLGVLLQNLTLQTNLTFTPEIDTHDIWHLTTQRTLAVEAK